MHDGDPPSQQAPDFGSLAQDWITVWQSELSGAAADREVQEAWQTWAALWAGAAGALLRGLPRRSADGSEPDRPQPRAAAAARPSPAAAAPDPRVAEIDRLAGRVVELERRLADLERDP